jgi:hypothetical protein
LEEELIEEQQEQEEIATEEVSLMQSLIDEFSKFDSEEDIDLEVDTNTITDFCTLLRSKDTIRRLTLIEDLDEKFAKAFYNYKIHIDSKKDYDKLCKILKNMHSNMCIDYFEENLTNKEVINE